MPKLSVIIPVYNVVDHIGFALDSVLASKCDDWECICVDDGSTDGSASLLDKYAAQDSRICVFHKPNGGVSSARNMGLRYARGEWISFLDGDDLLEMNCIFESIELAEQRQASFVSVGKTYWNKFDCRISESPAEICRMQGQSVWGAIYKRDLLEGLWFDERISYNEDMAFFSAVISRNPRMLSYNKLGYRITERIGSASRAALKARVFVGRLRAAEVVAKNFALAPSLNVVYRRFYLNILLEANFGDMRIGSVVRGSDDEIVYLNEVRHVLPCLCELFSGELTCLAKLMLCLAGHFPILIVERSCSWIVVFKVFMKLGWLVR